MRSVNCNINLDQGAFVEATLYPDNAGDPPMLFAGTVAEPHRLRFILPPDAPTGGGTITVRVPGKATWTGRTLMDGEGPSIELQDGQPVPFGRGGRPWAPCPRTYSGNMCGIYLPYLPPVAGGSSNASLFLSWFYDRYSADIRKRILEDYTARGFTDLLLSWPDSRAVGASPEAFAATCDEVYQAGLEPCVMLTSKDYDPPDVPELQRRLSPLLPLLKEHVGRICVGWELSIWLQPIQVQQLTDWLAPQIVPWGGKLYVHFQEGYASFDIDGPNASFAGYWNRNIGKLTGLLHQRVQDGPDPWDMGMYQARLVDILERFAGNYNCSPDSGFGHPFDCIALEITAMDAYNSNLSEAQQNAWARDAVTTQPVNGPLGPVRVMGSGNGVA